MHLLTLRKAGRIAPPDPSAGTNRGLVKMGMTRSEIRSIVVFGGAGFIGSNWTERLLRTTGAQVHVFDNLSRPGTHHNVEHLQELAGSSGRLQITVGDVRDAELVSRVVKPASEIYHFAAQVAVTTSLVDPAAGLRGESGRHLQRAGGCPATWQESLPAVHLDQQGVRQLVRRREPEPWFGSAMKRLTARDATSGRR